MDIGKKVIGLTGAGILASLIAGCAPKRVVDGIAYGPNENIPVVNYNPSHPFNDLSDEQLLMGDMLYKEALYVATFEYEVKSGETISELAPKLYAMAKKKFGNNVHPITQEDVKEFAGIDNPKLLQTGTLYVHVTRPVSEKTELMIHEFIRREDTDLDKVKYLVSHGIPFEKKK